MNSNKTIMFGIFLLALFLRILGTNPGYPLTHPDESTIANSALEISLHGNFKPIGYYYGSLLPLIYAVMDIAIFLPIFLAIYLPYNFIISTHLGSYGILGCIIENKPDMADCIFARSKSFIDYLGRYDTAILGAATVFLIYYLGKKLFNKQIGLVAAFLTAVNYRHVLSSVFSLADAPTAVFVLLSLYLSSKLSDKRSWKNYIWAGVGIGFALSTKYFIYVIFPFLFFHLISVWKEQKNRKLFNKLFLVLLDKKMFVSLLLSLVIFIVINPYIFLDWEKFVIEWDINSRRYGIIPGSLNIFNLKNITEISLFQVYYLVRYAFGPILFVLLVFGIIIGLFLNTSAIISFLLLIFPFFYFFMCLSKSPNVRNYSAIVPLLLILPSISIYWISKTISNLLKNTSIQKYVIIILVAISSFDGISKSIQTIRDFSKTQNSKNTLSWIQTNIPTQSKMIQYWGAVIPNNPPLKVVNIKPISELYVSRQEMQEKDIPWVIVSSGSQEYINNPRWILNNNYIKKNFFDDKSLINYLSEGYGNLVTREFYAYKVAEFSKSNSFLSLEPAFFISKIPPKINLSRLTPTNTISEVKIDEKECKKEIVQFPTQKSKVYVIQSILNTKATAKSDIKEQDGYLRLSILTTDGGEIGVSVSKQISSTIPNQEITNYGLVTDNNLTAKLFFQSDDCLNKNYQLKTIKIYESELEKYLDNNFSVNTNSFPTNFLWTLPL